MKVNSRRVIIVGCVLIVLLLSSCIDFEYKITINKDNSCDVQYKVLMNSMLMGFAEQNDTSNPFKDMTDSANKEGYIVSNITTEDKTGFKAEKHIANLEKALKEGDPFGEISKEFPIQPGKGIKIEKDLIKTRYSFNSNIDLTSLSQKKDEGSDDWTSSITNSMMQSMKFTFILSLPQKADTNNASTSEFENRLLTWNLIPGQENKIEASLVVPNIKNIIIIAISIGILLITTFIIIFVIIRKKRNLTTAST